MSPWSLLWGSLKARPLALLGAAALATLPLELLAFAMDWDAVHPGNVLAELLWLPVTMACQLAALGILGGRGSASWAGSLLSALGAELLLALRFCVVVLLCALPALACAAALGVEELGPQLLAAGLALAALPFCLLYLLRRFFAAPIVLWQGLSGAQALEESVRLSRGKLRLVLLPLLLWNGIGLILEGISGGAFKIVALPLSFLLSQASLAWAYSILTL
jgi:hypothetical protein